MAKIITNASSAIWWPKLQPMQVAPSGGQMQCNHWNQFEMILAEKKISQVLNSIPVRCASGNVFLKECRPYCCDFSVLHPVVGLYLMLTYLSL